VDKWGRNLKEDNQENSGLAIEFPFDLITLRDYLDQCYRCPIEGKGKYQPL